MGTSYLAAGETRAAEYAVPITLPPVRARGSVVGGIYLSMVGVPLPLVSYGGTSMVTLLLGFGMLMSIHTHKTLVQT